MSLDQAISPLVAIAQIELMVATATSASRIP